jgi:hypothetical protein
MVTGDGLEGDRRFAIFDVATGFGLTARRAPELLFASARLRGDGGVDIELPDGSLAPDDDALSEWLGRRVELRSADLQAPRRYENPEVDFEREAERDWAPFEGAPGPSTTPAGLASRSSRRTRSGRGTAAGSAPTCCSTAPERTSWSDRRSRSATRCSTSASGSRGA